MNFNCFIILKIKLISNLINIYRIKNFLKNNNIKLNHSINKKKYIKYYK